MPINDASVLFAADKTTTTTTTKTTTSPSVGAATLNALKPAGAQLELHLPNPRSNSTASAKFSDNALYKHQGQKWQQCFDFDRMLKQIRMCEKQQFRGGKSETVANTSGGGGNGNGTGSTFAGNVGNNSNGKNLPSPGISSISTAKSTSSTTSSSSSSSSTATSASSSSTGGPYTRQLRQVKRLNGNDMHYYGIVPKQAALGVIVCNVCMRIYTKMGFNNHMMIHHPTIWNTVSSKVMTSTGSSDTAYSIHTHENSQDGSREIGGGAGTEVLGSPSDLSGTMSTCSNASSTSSMSSSYVAKHKSSKNGSMVGSSSSSSSGSGGRSRSKSKHHNSSSSTSSTSADVSHTSSKSSKKSLSTTVSAANAANLAALSSGKDTAHGDGGGSSKAVSESMQSLAVYSSSSSNSSCSLPPTPRMINVSSTGDGGVTLSAPRAGDEATHSPAALAALNESNKDKLPADPVTQSTASTAKKKAHSPPFLGQETVDSSSSSSEFDHASLSSKAEISSATKLSKHAAFVSNVKVEKESHRSIGEAILMKKPVCEKDLKMYNTQISELDQAVSSITGCTDNHLMSGGSTNVAVSTMDISVSLGDKSQSIVSPANTASMPISATYAATQPTLTHPCEEAIPHNSSDDNSILTLEDMLDSKFINEILNTTDPEMHFDENELDTTAQQPYLNQQQQEQPAAKRMRYEDTITLAQQQVGDYAVYHQQQQPQQQQQYIRYDNTMENVKMYNTEQQLPLDAQYQSQLSKLLQQDQTQHQITTIDAMQLQQLLYQQQNLSNYSGSLGQEQQQQQRQQQFGEANMIDAKQIIDFCADDGIVKAEHTDVYEQQQCNAFTNQFQVFDIPSLTDDSTDDVLVPSMVDVLPSNEEQQHLIYEITANNQVAVLSQQRQHQMLAEFLTQANYDNVANVNNLPTTLDNNNQQQQQTQQIEAGDVGGGGVGMWNEVGELLDFDFTHIETVKSLSATTATTDSKTRPECSTTSNNNNSSSSNSNSKYHDDYYLNVFIYAGIPKPLAINSFGLIKLPQAVATTFRKNLLTTRKANNSPITLNSSLNGMAGGTNATSVMRLSNVSGKTTPSYFTSLQSSGGSGNDFSIGSITISNTPTLQQQQQHNSIIGIGGSVEIMLNANANSNSSGSSGGSTSQTATTTSTTTTQQQHKGRTKGGTNAATTTASAAAVVAALTSTAAASPISTQNVGGSIGGSGTGKSKTGTLGMSTAAMTTTPISRTMGRQNTVAQQQAKTIFVSNTSGATNERVKCIKRSLIARVDPTKKPPPTLLTKHIAEILSAGKPTSKPPPSLQQQQQQPQQQQTPTSAANDAITESEAASIEYQLSPLKQTRVRHFYEHRKKLFNLTSARHKQQQLFNKQLLRTRPPSDCSGSNSSSSSGFKVKSNTNNNNSSSSNNNNNNNAPNSSNNNNNDIMRVFV